MPLNKQQDRPAERDDESDIGSHSSDLYADMTDCSSVSVYSLNMNTVRRQSAQVYDFHTYPTKFNSKY